MAGKNHKRSKRSRRAKYGTERKLYHNAPPAEWITLASGTKVMRVGGTIVEQVGKPCIDNPK